MTEVQGLAIAHACASLVWLDGAKRSRRSEVRRWAHERGLAIDRELDGLPALRRSLAQNGSRAVVLVPATGDPIHLEAPYDVSR